MNQGWSRDKWCVSYMGVITEGCCQPDRGACNFLHALEGRPFNLPGTVCGGWGGGGQGTSWYVFMQIGSHSALHIGACPGQLMKLVISVLSSPKQRKLSLAQCEKSHPYYWTGSRVTLPTSWLMCLHVTLTTTSNTWSLLSVLTSCAWFKWICFCPHSGKVSLFWAPDWSTAVLIFYTITSIFPPLGGWFYILYSPPFFHH